MAQGMLYELFKQFDGAFAESTIKAYRADFSHFNRWCEANQLAPLEASPE